MSAPAGAPYPTRLLLVDGSGLLFQMFYGMPARIVNGEGKAYGGTLGGDYKNFFVTHLFPSPCF